MSGLPCPAGARLTHARPAPDLALLFCDADWQECRQTARHELGTDGEAVTRRQAETF
jgi:hypothetical protein